MPLEEYGGPNLDHEGCSAVAEPGHGGMCDPCQRGKRSAKTYAEQPDEGGPPRFASCRTEGVWLQRDHTRVVCAGRSQLLSLAIDPGGSVNDMSGVYNVYDDDFNVKVGVAHVSVRLGTARITLRRTLNRVQTKYGKPLSFIYRGIRRQDSLVLFFRQIGNSSRHGVAILIYHDEKDEFKGNIMYRDANGINFDRLMLSKRHPGRSDDD